MSLFKFSITITDCFTAACLITRLRNWLVIKSASASARYRTGLTSFGSTPCFMCLSLSRSTHFVPRATASPSARHRFQLSHASCALPAAPHSAWFASHFAAPGKFALCASRFHLVLTSVSSRYHFGFNGSLTPGFTLTPRLFVLLRLHIWLQLERSAISDQFQRHAWPQLHVRLGITVRSPHLHVRLGITIRSPQLHVRLCSLASAVATSTFLGFTVLLPRRHWSFASASLFACFGFTVRLPRRHCLFASASLFVRLGIIVRLPRRH